MASNNLKKTMEQGKNVLIRQNLEEGEAIVTISADGTIMDKREDNSGMRKVNLVDEAGEYFE